MNRFAGWGKAWPITVWLMPLASTSAHHSYAMFDKAQNLMLEGTLYAVEWRNPHSWVWVQADDARGAQTLWGFEGGSPAVLTHQGYTKQNLVVGTPVVVHYNPLKDGRNGGNLVDIVIGK